MSTVLVGHASISETGGINGAKGDSTGKEVCTRTWYSKPWDYMAIHPDATVREKHAKAIEAACANNNIGYGQSDRNTANTEAKKVNYDISKIKTKCNTDCSSLQNLAAVASGAPGVTYGSNGWTTSTMKSALQAAGYKIITDSTYLKSADYCVRGAIYVKSGSHTVCGLTNGSKYTATLSKAGIGTSTVVTSTTTASSIYYNKYTGTSTAIDTVLKDIGVPNTLYGSVTKRNPIATANGISGYTGTAAQNLSLIALAKKGTLKQASASSASIITSSPYIIGKVYTTQVDNLNIRTGAGASYPKVSYNNLSANAKKYANSSGQLKKGTSVTCQALKTIGSDIWMQIPSGWVAAYYSGKYYIK